MDESKQREIASRGGRTAHAQGTAHKFSPEEAREAGRKGGKAVSGDRSHMARIGRRGGQARHARSQVKNASATATGTATPNNPPATATESANEPTFRSDTSGDETQRH
jgi:general stress protein YciG